MSPWWKNSRGELFVIAQFAIFGLLAFGPRTIPGLPEWSSGARAIGRIGGCLLLAAGSLLAVAGTLKLGRNLTPLITPSPGSQLQAAGAYRLVRHPIYSGLLQVALGWGLWLHGWLTLGLALLLFLVLDIKSRREEALLRRVFPEYEAYSHRVKRLLPFIY